MALITIERKGGRDYQSRVLRGLGAAGDMETNEGPQLYRDNFSVPYEDASAQVSNSTAMAYANAAPIVDSAAADTSNGIVTGSPTTDPAVAPAPAPAPTMSAPSWMWPLLAALVGLAGGYYVAGRMKR